MQTVPMQVMPIQPIQVVAAPPQQPQMMTGAGHIQMAPMYPAAGGGGTGVRVVGGPPQQTMSGQVQVAPPPPPQQPPPPGATGASGNCGPYTAPAPATGTTSRFTIKVKKWWLNKFVICCRPEVSINSDQGPVISVETTCCDLLASATRPGEMRSTVRGAIQGKVWRSMSSLRFEPLDRELFDPSVAVDMTSTLPQFVITIVRTGCCAWESYASRGRTTDFIVAKNSLEKLFIIRDYFYFSQPIGCCDLLCSYLCCGSRRSSCPCPDPCSSCCATATLRTSHAVYGNKYQYDTHPPLGRTESSREIGHPCCIDLNEYGVMEVPAHASPEELVQWYTLWDISKHSGELPDNTPARRAMHV